MKEDDDKRGRASGEVANLIVKGINQVEEASGESFAYQIQLNEADAVNSALDNAPEGSLVVVLPESVSRAISLISAKGPVSEGFSATAPVAGNGAISSSSENSTSENSTESELSAVVTAADVQSLNGTEASVTPSVP